MLKRNKWLKLVLTFLKQSIHNSYAFLWLYNWHCTLLTLRKHLSFVEKELRKWTLNQFSIFSYHNSNGLQLLSVHSPSINISSICRRLLLPCVYTHVRSGGCLPGLYINVRRERRPLFHQFNPVEFGKERKKVYKEVQIGLMPKICSWVLFVNVFIAIYG